MRSCNAATNMNSFDPKKLKYFEKNALLYHSKEFPSPQKFSFKNFPLYVQLTLKKHFNASNIWLTAKTLLKG